MHRLPLAPSLLFKGNVSSASFTFLRTPRHITRQSFTTSHNTPFRYRTLATMTSTQSKACCTVPPVVSDGYKEKGEWMQVEGMKTYATGPKNAKSALLIVYDIFGFFPQTIQGADILAHSDKEHQYQVFMPDFFDGKPADISWYPPDSKEKGEKLGEYV